MIVDLVQPDRDFATSGGVEYGVVPLCLRILVKMQAGSSMKRLLICLIAVTLLFVNPSFGGKKVKPRNWQTGKLVDSQSSQSLVGTVDRPGVVLTNGRRITNDSKQAVYATQEIFVLEGETLTYTVSETLGRGATPANLTVNGPIKFAVEGGVLYLLDESGKEHRTEIVKKVLRQPSEPPK
jgi:hypothetical protein